MDLKSLRVERRSHFWGEIIPYLGYVMQSGVAVLFMFVLITFSAWYTSLVQHIPEGLPIRWIMLVLLVPLTVQSSFRTYLQSPDVVFLLPQESKMNQYLSGSWFSGVVYKLVGLLLVFLIAWPLYVRSDAEPKPFWTFLMLLVILKIISSYGGWKELSMVSNRAAMGYRLLRWGVMILAIASWLWEPTGKSLVYIGLLCITYIVAGKFPVKHLVAWERLIEKEKTQIGRVMSVLGWFVNVPERQQRVYSRRLLSSLGSGIPWKSNYAYRYLITKSFIRSDILGIIIRGGLLGLLLIWSTRGSLLASGIYLFFLFIIGMQLSSLKRYHSESFWLNIYPVQPNSRQENVTVFVFRVITIIACILWLPLLGTGLSQIGLLVGTLVAGLLMSVLFRILLSRKSSMDPDEE
ncbi:ABC transporter permease [Paenibacillus sp. IHBB 10380]|uniref:ABC transporter permease n=1 Tax=Paenibacillus sp. IHBB 10380 TaxID=1566358 RepID=UPI0005CFC0FB|nr:ABC transporter permease [Paenibacillus sp. IHBB 10380]AJS57446.1 hypothetical protein UB51_01865 [Paenibacillus sp. IHBB 10380]